MILNKNLLLYFGGIKIGNNRDNEESLEKKSTPEYIDIDAIYQKVAPYLEDPEFVKEFLNKHSKKLKTELIEVIEQEVKKSDSVRCTDLRIILNSI